MLGVIAVPSVIVVFVVGLFLAVRKRPRNPGRHVSDLSPVSGQWLADYRRSG
jgi:hypothetical protein